MIALSIRQEFLIRYIDSNNLHLESPRGLEILEIQDGNFKNVKITTIELLYRNKYPGYAMQNGLLPNKLITITFSTSQPFEIHGEITGLMNDQIVVKTSQQRTIYLDFAYKGIPLDIPIHSIIVQDKAERTSSVSNDVVKTSESKSESESESESVDESKSNIDADDDSPIVYASGEIKFGEHLASITQVVEIPDSERRFHIDKQTDALLESMLATIPKCRKNFPCH